MGGPRWTQQEVRELKMIYRYKTLEEMSAFLNRPLPSIKSKLKELDIKLVVERGHLRHNPHNAWSEKDLNFIKKNAGQLDSIELGRLLNRTPKAIKHKAAFLGLSLKKSSWTEEQMDILLARRSKGVCWADISVELGKTVRACQRKHDYLHGK